MTHLEFWKTETIGNDFVLIRPNGLSECDLAPLARWLCERRFGVGSDGLLVASPAEFGLSLRMFNPDGTEDFCGNGLRCAGWHGHLEGWVSREFSILHGGRRVATRVSNEGDVSIELPAASFEPKDVPIQSSGSFVEQVVHGVKGTALTTGSTHFVAIVDRLPDDGFFHEVSPLIEVDPLFPSRTSVIYAEPVSQSHLRLRIWERGVGETLGCGTGSSAAAVVWSRLSGSRGHIIVDNPGGELKIFLEDWRSPIVSTSRPKRLFAGQAVVPTDVRLQATSANLF